MLIDSLPESFEAKCLTACVCELAVWDRVLDEQLVFIHAPKKRSAISKESDPSTSNSALNLLLVNIPHMPPHQI